MEEPLRATTICCNLHLHSHLATLTKQSVFYEPDFEILTSDGLLIPVHTGILVCLLSLLTISVLIRLNISPYCFFFF